MSFPSHSKMAKSPFSTQLQTHTVSCVLDGLQNKAILILRIMMEPVVSMATACSHQDMRNKDWMAQLISLIKHRTWTHKLWMKLTATACTCKMCITLVLAAEGEREGKC